MLADICLYSVIYYSFPCDNVCRSLVDFIVILRHLFRTDPGDDFFPSAQALRFAYMLLVSGPNKGATGKPVPLLTEFLLRRAKVTL